MHVINILIYFYFIYLCVIKSDILFYFIFHVVYEIHYDSVITRPRGEGQDHGGLGPGRERERETQLAYINMLCILMLMMMVVCGLYTLH